MSNIPTLEEIVQAVDALALRRRRQAPQGRPATYPDGVIVALAVYRKLAGFRYAKRMLAVLGSLGVAVPSAATFCGRKAALLGQTIRAVEQLCAKVQATRQHLDSEKLEVIGVVRAKRTVPAGLTGMTTASKRPSTGLGSTP